MHTTLVVLVLIAIVAVSAYLYINYQSQITGIPTYPFDIRRGTLNGTVNIGPLCPNVQNPPGCLTKPDFSQYKLVVTKGDCPTGGQMIACRIIEVARIPINNDGTYSDTLLVGNYSVTIDPKVGFNKQDSSFEIIAGQTTTLNLDFDTGIR